MEMKTALLRIPAFIIDLVLVSGVIMLTNKIAVHAGLVTGFMPAEALMLLAIPLGFFVYWLTGLHLGKRLFGLKVIDAKTGHPPSGFQWFRRCLLFSLLVSLNVFLIIPVLVSREQKGFHDMVAGTRVVFAGELANKQKEG
ncbi:RDD family protein [Alcanivorax sp.]|uniref:RDD family protein n=1 Tax=Alcanivorax sp. TaxID=1872427 RepID=UPI0025C64616|nr:RDD family protein [Alcanivorax sp.]